MDFEDYGGGGNYLILSAQQRVVLNQDLQDYFYLPYQLF
jgi:hypothetical protein